MPFSDTSRRDQVPEGLAETPIYAAPVNADAVAEADQPEPQPYQYFETATQRRIVVAAGARTADYMATNNIGSIALVDRLARNLYAPLLAAHRKLVPEQPTPTVYFLNPNAFMSYQTHDIHSMARPYFDLIASMLGLENRQALATHLPPDTQSMIGMHVLNLTIQHIAYDVMTGGQQRIVRSLAPAIEKVKKQDPKYNGRVLVMDGCAHTGASMRGIVDTLRSAGVTSVHTGVLAATSGMSNYPVNFTAFKPNELINTCNVVGEQEVLSKHPMHSLSVTATKPLSEQDKLVRKELHRIMDEIDWSRVRRP